MKILVVVDCQNDFISGSLGSKEAQAIVPNVIEKIKNLAEDDVLIFTQDEHCESEYLLTQEGINLPIKHCIFNSDGIKIHSDILKAADDIGKCYGVHHKNSFGSFELGEGLCAYIKEYDIEEIEFVGLCTDICVITNVLIAKTCVPETKIVVDASCCAGVTPESHKAALTVMKSCQIKVINEH